MRFLTILFLFVAFAPIAAEAEPVDKAQARAYYDNCLKNQSPNMSVDTQKLLCACTAVQMHKTMQVEDVRDMALQNEVGREATNKMIVSVYAPCMQHPAKELYYQNCISDPKTQTLTKNPQKTCECMSGNIAQYLSTRGVDIFQSILTRSPNITDPMAALAEDPQFEQYTRTQLMGCL